MDFFLGVQLHFTIDRIFLAEIKMHSFGLFRLSLAENIIIPQGVVDMDKRIATIIGMNLQRL